MIKKLFVTLSLCHFVTCGFAAMLDTDSAKTITADKIEYDTKTQSVKTSGRVRIENASGQSANADAGFFSQDYKTANARNAEMMLGAHTHVSAADMKRDGALSVANDISYTTCWDGGDACVRGWEITASKLSHDNDRHMMTFRNMVFWFYDAPIFWSPYLTYPDPLVRRKSGVLMPSMNSTNKMGMQFNLPVYVAFSDTHDATATLSYLTAENPLLQLEHRLNTAHTEFRTTGSWTDSREMGSRWHIFNRDEIEIGEHARATLFLNRTGDKTYLQKYGFYDAQPYLDSGARAELFSRSGYATADVHVFQELRSFGRNNSNSANPSGNILPNIHGTIQTPDLWNGAYMSFMADAIGITTPDMESATQRILGEARITLPAILPFGQKLTASIAARYDLYNFNNTPIIDGPSDFDGTRGRFLPSGYLDWSLPFAKIGEKLTQVIEPRARITFVDSLSNPGFANIDSAASVLSDAMLFADKRYAGYDLWAHGTYLDYGVGWTGYYDDITANAFVGQSFDFYRPNAIDPNSGYRYGASDYVGRMSVDMPSDMFSVSSRFRLDRDKMQIRHIETAAKFGNTQYALLGHIYGVQLLDADTIDSRTHEIVAGAGIKLTDRWSVAARTTYNVTESHLQRQTAGVYYDHPCWGAALEYARDGAIRLNDAGDIYRGNTTIHLKFDIKFTE
ncbi:MAG: LPS assembly protein LptD [Rickettsiales bacterium]|jgi:LPS-assembly protein|nr:LPS assembly protein LptD [Rickettsiales bacterium]